MKTETLIPLGFGLSLELYVEQHKYDTCSNIIITCWFCVPYDSLVL